MANKQKGYIDIKVGGKKRTLHFSMNFWAAFEQASGFSISEIDKVFGGGLSLSSMRALVYSGLLAYDQEKGNQVDYTIYSVGDWMEDVNQDQLTLIVETLMQSQTCDLASNISFDDVAASVSAATSYISEIGNHGVSWNGANTTVSLNYAIDITDGG